MTIAEIIILLRNMIDDLDSANYTYTDARLTQLIVVAAQCVVYDIEKSDTYTVDITAETITPDVDVPIGNLIAKKAACMLSKSEAKSTSACSGMKVVDGPSTIELKGQFKNLKEMSDVFCADYTKSLMMYLAGNYGGCVSTTPYGPDYYGPTYP